MLRDVGDRLDRPASTQLALLGVNRWKASARPSERIAVAIESHGWSAMLVLSGELDLAGADLVRDALTEIEQLAPQRLVIDLSRLSFIDSSGLHVLLSEHLAAQARGRPQLEIRRGPRAVQRVF